MFEIKNEVMERLTQGESPENLANEIAAILNSAINEVKAKEEAEAKAKAEAEKQATMDELAGELLEILEAYFMLAFPELNEVLDEVFEEMEVADIHEVMSAIAATMSIGVLLGGLADNKPAAPIKPFTPAEKENDPLTSFLRQNGLLS